MCKVQVAAALVSILHPPHANKVDLKVMERGGNTVRGFCGLVEVQYQLQELPLGASSIGF